MSDVILIIAIGVIALFILRGFQLLSRDLDEVVRQNSRIEQRLFWSRRRELKTVKLVERIFKKV